MGEKYVKNIFYELPLYQVIQAFNANILTIAKNHFFKQMRENTAPDETFPFLHIPAIQN